ncbi:MAG: flagellar biosynthetic protein FliO [Bdellovibrionota bacterium]
MRFWLVSIFAFLATFFIPQSAVSAVKLNQVNAKRSDSGVMVDLLFDRPVLAKSIKPSYERNFVQLVLKSTKIDAARMVTVSQSEVQKVFAYPYDSDTTRLRIILKSDHRWAKGKLTLWNTSPRAVRVFLKEPLKAEKTSFADEPKAVEKTNVASPVEKPEEKKLISEVIKNTAEIDIHNPESVRAALEQPLKSADKEERASKEPADDSIKSIAPKSDPSRHFLRMFVVLFAILALFGGGVFLLKRYSGKLKKLPFGKKERLIQVVATHYLGGKKSMSLVKVAGEYMVVGVSNEGISLITKLGAEVNVEKYLEDRFWGGTFEKHLGSYAKDPKVSKEIDLADAQTEQPAVKASITHAPINPKNYDGARDVAEDSSPAGNLIKGMTDRVELSPVRASIKQKLTKLKPLA